MKRSVMMVLFVFLAVISLANQVQGSDRVLNVAIPTDPDSFHPHKSVAAATTEIAFNIYEGLVKANPDGTIRPAIATHWEVDSTKTRYTFYIREAYFHNGRRVEPEDVVNSLRNAKNPEISASKADEYAIIQNVYAEGNKVIVELKEPYGPFIYSLVDIATSIYPRNAQNLENKPIGTGPYQLVEWRPNQHIKLERFDRYWGEEQPYYDEITLRIIPDENSAVLNLKAGYVDIIPRLEPSLLHQVENFPKLTIYSAPMNLVQVLSFNSGRPPFDDARVRRALAMAVNRDEVIVGAAWGQGEPLYSGISPAMGAFFNDSLAKANPYNPTRAKELLAEAGVLNLKLTLDLPAPYSLHIQAGEIVAQQWERIGVEVDVEIVEWGTWLERVYRQRDYDVSIIGLAGRLDPHPILVRYTTGSSRNFFNFSNPRYDELIAEALGALEERRQQLYWEAQQILAEEAAGVFLMDPNHMAVMDKSIRGWQSYPIYVIDLAALYQE